MITQVQTEQMLRQVGKTLAAFDNATDYIVSVSWETPVGVKCCCVASTPTLDSVYILTSLIQSNLAGAILARTIDKHD